MLNADQTPLFSEFASDPEMIELIDIFVDELGNRIASLEQAWRDVDHERLRVLSHQLKGRLADTGSPQLGMQPQRSSAQFRSALLIN